ncbi:D-alanyl-D-alanine carboxypeptidase family protein [Gordoniibacillus kamchatkensis]|uniref:D-alanyl-D-alanine carboxypeptidase family protein n=1 Tax=Gordoniibacillus kamchatkensis TaxID=1590651 RepID=UPI0009E4AB51|nr:D-alanyl-D-alanine carboxypeptidase family protein [Paenibacillus sp. VKM B-2647]
MIKHATIAISVTIIGTVVTATAAEAAAAQPVIEAKSAILIEASTGAVLLETNPDQPMPPASMTKMMTEYIVLERIKSGSLKEEEQVVVSPYATKIGGSGQLLAAGEKQTVGNLMKELGIYSGNDAAIALAEHVSGSEEEFVKLMNQTAEKLGMKNAHFINATGMPREDMGTHQPADGGETVMSARDTAVLARHLVRDHPEILDVSKIPSLKFRERDSSPMINWNWMLEGNRNVANFRKFVYEGMDGLKTGHTDDAGHCFTGTAERNGMRLISVVMGTASMSKQFEETRKLMDYGFQRFSIATVLPRGSAIQVAKTVPVQDGAKEELSVVTDSDVQMVVAKDEPPALKFQLSAANGLAAPVHKGSKAGTVTVSYGDQVREVNLLADEDVEKASWIKRLAKSIGLLWQSLLASIGGGGKA